MSKSTRRKSAQALAKKFWSSMRLKNKDQKKSSRVRSSISDDTSKDDDNRPSLSVSSQESIPLEPQAAGLDEFIEVDNNEEEVDDDSYCLLPQSMDAVESNQIFPDHGQHEHDDSGGEEVIESNSLPVTVLQANLDEGEDSVSKGASNVESEQWMEILTLNDNTSYPSRDEEDANTLKQSQGFSQQFEESSTEEVDDSCLSQSINAVESNQELTQHRQHEHDDTDSDMSPATVLQVNLDDSVQGEGSVGEGVGKMESEDRSTVRDEVSRAESEEALEDKTPIPSRDEVGASTLTQSLGTEKNTFVEGAAVHIIKGTHRGKCGIISRVTSKCVFISIKGFDKDVRKTKSIEFLKTVDNEVNNKLLGSNPQEAFVEGNLVRIKKGVHKDYRGIISRVMEKCVYVSIRGLPKDVRKKKSAEFLELLNDGANCAPQHLDQQASSEEGSEVSAFVVGTRVRIVKGNHLGQCGVISRFTNKSVFVSIKNMPKDIRKTKSDQFLQVVNPDE